MNKFKSFFVKVGQYIKEVKKQLIVLCSLLITTFACMGLADGFQKDWGKITVESGEIQITTVDGEDCNVGYKIYIPKGVNGSNKAPAALCLHGYQNDHETSAGYALELARHGYVALAIDEFGHGSTTLGIASRGYVNHKVAKTCYGWDKEEDGTYSLIGGPNRYKVMMNFSNLDFFISKYSEWANEDGTTSKTPNYIKDSSMGGTAAYAWLAAQNYVDNTRMIVTGHSMGTWASWSVSAAMAGATLNGVDITPRATILQAGEIFKTTRDSLGRLAYDKNGDNIPDVFWNNVLILTAKYDEFNYFRDYNTKPCGDEVIHDEQSANFLGVTNPNQCEWNKTFHENFTTGTSVRRNLYVTNHRLLTHNNKAITDALNWCASATNTPLTIDAANHTFLAKESLVFAAMLTAIASVVAMVMMFKPSKWFAPVFAGVPNRPEKVKSGWKWWKGALLTMAISALTYPFCTQLGHGLFPLPERVFSMTIGNGFLIWYLILILVMLGFTLIPWFKRKKKAKAGIEVENIDFVDLGFARDDEEHKNKFDWALLGKSAIVVLAGVVWMYLQTIICQAIFQLDFRFIWPFFKGFNWARFGQFMVYIPFFALFFVLNNSRIFAASRVPNTEKKGFKAFLSCWYKYALCMVGGILFIILLEYIPFFMGFGPGADLLFSTTFGGPFMSLLIVFAPQVIVFSFICTYCYRKTGNVFVGALIVAILACWIVTGGSAIMYC